MPKVKVSRIINAPADKVWKSISDFNGLDEFVEAVAKCTTEGSGIGAVRTLTLEDGGKVKEKLESQDNESKILTYSIVESPMPIENYTGTMKVDELEDGRSEFVWSSAFDAAEGTKDNMKEALEALEGLYKIGVKGLQQKFSN